MSLKYTCPGCGTPLGYEGSCWKCKCEQERQAALTWAAGMPSPRRSSEASNLMCCLAMQGDDRAREDACPHCQVVSMQHQQT